MTVKGTSEKEVSKSKTMDSDAGIQAKASGKSGGNRRTLGIVGCVVLLLILCCIGSLVVLWYSGDSLLEILQNYLQ